VSAEEYFEANRRHWDEVVPIHVASDLYDVAGFKAGKSRLKRVEREELTGVRGQTLLHLQCHFGLDTLSWAREGAVVTGIDFSGPALEAARSLAEEYEVEARFIHSDVYSLREKLSEQFDIVFTSYGAICWLPDMTRWAEVVAHFVKPGGTFYMVEFHPMCGVFDNDPTVRDLHVRYPYFNSGEPIRTEEDGTYADRGAKVTNRLNYSWPHPTSNVITSLIEAGLRIEFFHEFPFSTEHWFPFMEERGERGWRLTKHDGCVPLMYSVKATKPA
jgi:ubiquinone/menaquinone biosynthesis C-methylase UbiE